MVSIEQYQAKEIEFLKAQNAIMDSISTSEKFFNFYFFNLKNFRNQESCFTYCNELYRNHFGSYRYESFEQFKNLPEYNEKQSSSKVDKLEYQFLMALFKNKGFDTWISFKALVLHYYPEITEKRLSQFYHNEAIDAEVLKKVEWVRQIIG
jgi:hypothetical protein